VVRDPEQLAKRSFDLLVVGAGIYGATIAWDAALRGLSVALIDRGDFGAATSANSLKTVHGGLRSLQRGNLCEMRSFIRDRRALLRIAPHLVEPIAFAIPTFRRPFSHPWTMRAAFLLNDLAAVDRNRGLDPARRIPAGRVVSRSDYLAYQPGVDPAGVIGGAIWSDAQLFSSDRLLLGFVQSAVDRGAVALNYVEALSLNRTAQRVHGAVARDRLSGRSYDIEARVVVNAAGAWAPALSATAVEGGRRPRVRFAKALNLVTRLPTPCLALGAGHEGRFYFRVPWRGVSIFGTSQDPFDHHPEDLQVERDDVERLLTHINAAFPGVSVGVDDVTLVHKGLLLSAGQRDDEVLLAKKSLVWDHRQEGVDGLITVVGVRYTTARETASGVVDVVYRQLGLEPPPCQTASTPLAGGDVGSMDELLRKAEADRPSGLPRPALERLVRAYGAGYRAVLLRLVRDPGLARPLGQASGVTAAEIVHAVEDEMAVTLADALVRRTEAGAAAWPGESAVAAAAAIMASRLGWNEERRTREVNDLRTVYAFG
jgi:glycerol-3-phosphate dehydrogenase